MWRFENLGVGDEHMRCRLALGNQLNDGSTVKMLQNEHFHFDHRECNTHCSIQTAALHARMVDRLACCWMLDGWRSPNQRELRVKQSKTKMPPSDALPGGG